MTFDCGKDVEIIIAALVGQGVRRLCVCDGNPALLHTSFEGGQVLSIDNARERYGG